MNLTVQVSGVDALSLKVKYLAQAARQGLKFGVSEAAGMFLDEARNQVPIDTGNLFNHIHTETTVDEPEKQVLTVTPVNEASNEYGIDPPYARRIEFGFMGVDKLGRHYHQAPQPFMRPAFDMHESAARTAIKESIYDSLDNAMAATSQRGLSGRGKGQG